MACELTMYCHDYPDSTAMNDSVLARKLIVVVLIKVAAITLLWWLFIRGQHVEVVDDTIADHFGQQQSIHLQGSPHGQ